MTAQSIAVVGGSGFVGGEVVRRLVAAGYDVHGSFRTEKAPPWHVDDVNCSWAHVDLDHPATIAPFVRDMAAVVHCAGHVPQPGQELAGARQVAVRQLRSLLDICLASGVRRVVYVSSITTALQQLASSEDVDETHRYVPGSTSNIHFEVKAAMEAEVYRYVASGLDVVIALPTVVLGPGDRRSWAGRFVRSVAADRLPLRPTGLTINIVDVRDLAKGVVAALQRGRTGRRYILGGTDIELSELIEAVADVSGSTPSAMTIDALRAAPVIRLAQRAVQGGWPGARRASSIATIFEIARRSNGISRKRAAGELNAPTRRLQHTIRDTVQWFCRVGYLDWGNQLRCWPPSPDSLYGGLDRYRSFC